MNIDSLALNLPFDIVSQIIFGMELNEKVGKVNYTNPETGDEKSVSFYDSVSSFVNDLYYVEGNAFSLVFPFLRTWRLKSEVKASSKNNTIMMQKLKETLE